MPTTFTLQVSEQTTKCNACHNMIETGSLQFGASDPIVWGGTNYWRHIECVTGAQLNAAFGQSIHGYDTLDHESQLQALKVVTTQLLEFESKEEKEEFVSILQQP